LAQFANAVLWININIQNVLPSAQTYSPQRKTFWRFCRNCFCKWNQKNSEIIKNKKLGYFVVKTIRPRDVPQRWNSKSYFWKSPLGGLLSILGRPGLGCYGTDHEFAQSAGTGMSSTTTNHKKYVIVVKTSIAMTVSILHPVVSQMHWFLFTRLPLFGMASTNTQTACNET